jgi:hypothetical protein
LSAFDLLFQLLAKFPPQGGAKKRADPVTARIILTEKRQNPKPVFVFWQFFYLAVYCLRGS